MKKKQALKVSVAEFAATHNTVLNRRNQKMDASYLYRLIRDDIKGIGTRKLWFKYVLEGEKENVKIIVEPISKATKPLSKPDKILA